MATQRRLPGESRFKGWIYLAPGFIIYLVFVFYPLLETIRTSFYQWDGFSTNRSFVGLSNYLRLFQDQQFFQAIQNNIIFIVFYSIIPIIIGLFLASLLGRKPIPGLTFFRTVLFLPQILSMVVVGVTWRWIFNPTFGLLNMTLKTIGLDSLAKAWLGDFGWALPAVGLIGTWVQYGFCMILFLAGMQRIPGEYFEAAQLDGASEFKQLLFITLPSLRPELSVALMTTIIAALRVFDLIYVTTRGGPGNSTLVTGFLVYRAAFQQNKIGYAAALATIMTVMIFGISMIIQHLQKRWE